MTRTRRFVAGTSGLAGAVGGGSFGGGTAVFSGVNANGGGTEGNTFAPLAALPAWVGPGDPRQVPLPNGMAVIAGEGACPGF